MRTGLAFTLILSFLPGQAIHTCQGSEDTSPVRFVLHFQKRINNIRIEKGKLSGQGKKKYEHKAYLHKDCPDRRCIR